MSQKIYLTVMKKDICQEDDLSVSRNIVRTDIMSYTVFDYESLLSSRRHLAKKYSDQ